MEQRILPIFQSAKPSSCAECHLSGVDLKEYIRPTQQETFASLVADEMIDLKNPDESKILKFIDRSPEKASLASEKVRKHESEAFPAGPNRVATSDRPAARDRPLFDQFKRKARATWTVN